MVANQRHWKNSVIILYPLSKKTDVWDVDKGFQKDSQATRYITNFWSQIGQLDG